MPANREQVSGIRKIRSLARLRTMDVRRIRKGVLELS